MFGAAALYRKGVGAREFASKSDARQLSNHCLDELSRLDKDRSSAVSNIGIKERRVGSVTILGADGEIRIGLRFGGSSVSLPSAVDSLLEQGQRHILLNLAGVASIDARGLGELVSSYMVVTRSGGQFKLLNLTQTVRELMMTTKLQTVFDVYESESQAIASFAGGTSASA